MSDIPIACSIGGVNVLLPKKAHDVVETQLARIIELEEALATKTRDWETVKGNMMGWRARCREAEAERDMAREECKRWIKKAAQVALGSHPVSESEKK